MDCVRREVDERWLAKDPDDIGCFVMSRKSARIWLFRPTFLVILSTWRSTFKHVLCLGLNSNSLSRVSPRWFTTCKSLASRVFQMKYRSCPRD